MKLNLQLPPLLGTAVCGQWQSLSVSLGLFMPQKWYQQEAEQRSRGREPLHRSSSSPENHFTARAALHCLPFLPHPATLTAAGSLGSVQQKSPGTTENKNLQYHFLPISRSSLSTQLVLRCYFISFLIAKDVVHLLPPEVCSTERRIRIFDSATVCLW